MESPDSPGGSDYTSEDEGSSDSEFAHSLFDDFRSKDTSLVYRHMAEKFGFRPDLLGRSTLHRIALLRYLQESKENNLDVLDCYKRVQTDKGIVLDRMDYYLSRSLGNDKLIYGYTESSDSQEDQLISQYVNKG